MLRELRANCWTSIVDGRCPGLPRLMGPGAMDFTGPTLGHPKSERLG